MGTGA